MKTITVQLDDPITAAGEEVAELTIRKPTVKDLRLSNSSAKDELERTLNMIRDLAGIAPDDLDQLSLTDLGRINEEMAKANFIPAAPTPPNG